MTSAAKHRVLHVLHSFLPSGMERVVASIVEGLDDRFEHSLLFMTESRDEWYPIPTDVSWRVLRKPEGNSLRFAWQLSRELARQRPDLLCTYNWNGMDSILAGRLAGIRRIVQCEHGWAGADPTGANPRRRHGRRWLSRWTRMQICVSAGLQAWLETEVRVRAPVRMIHNGIDTEHYRPKEPCAALRRELDIGPKEFVVAAVARLDPIKNPRLLLSAFARLRTTHPESRLLWIGDGELRSDLEAVADSRVRFLGARADVADLLNLVDVVVMPSDNEGISLAVLEAMACERPVIACAVGGNPDVILHGKTGMLVPARDPDAMANALSHYCTDVECRASHGAAGRQRVIGEFSERAMLTHYASAYAAVLDGTG